MNQSPKRYLKVSLPRTLYSNTNFMCRIICCIFDFRDGLQRHLGRGGVQGLTVDWLQQQQGGVSRRRQPEGDRVVQREGKERKSEKKLEKKSSVSSSTLDQLSEELCHFVYNLCWANPGLSSEILQENCTNWQDSLDEDHDVNPFTWSSMMYYWIHWWIDTRSWTWWGTASH